MSTTTTTQRFSIRPFRASDFDRLWEIDQACFPPGIAYSQMELTAYIMRRKAITLVAEWSGEADTGKNLIVGYAVAQPVRKTGRILTIDIAPEARRSGLGSRLMKECEQRLRSAGCTEVFLEAAVDNEAALRMYQKLGYTVLRTLPEYYSSHNLDAFLLGKSL